MIKLLTLAVGLFAMTFIASAATLTQCPPTGLNTGGCRLLVTITGASAGATTSFTVTTTTNAPDNQPYDNSEDTLIGVMNSSGASVSTLPLSSTLSIFGFDADGPCGQSPGPTNCNPAALAFGYGGPGVTFTGINGATTSGTVNFTPALADGATAWFGLEEAITAPQIGGSVPEPASLALIGTGLCTLFFVRRRKA
jgi:hypothetical protein